jgi:hypothetical protein
MWMLWFDWWFPHHECELIEIDFVSRRAVWRTHL